MKGTSKSSASQLAQFLKQKQMAQVETSSRASSALNDSSMVQANKMPIRSKKSISVCDAKAKAALSRQAMSKSPIDQQAR